MIKRMSDEEISVEEISDRDLNTRTAKIMSAIPSGIAECPCKLATETQAKPYETECLPTRKRKDQNHMKILDGSSQSEKSRHTKFQPNGRGWNTNKIAINIMETLDELPASTRPTKVHHKLHAATKEVYEPYIFKVHHQLRAANKEVYEPHIFKVHHQLRAANKEVYEPVLVSIGPYYHDKRKSQLQYMEQHKLRYLQDLLKRKEEKEGPTEFDQIREYLGVLEELEDEARGYYADPIALEKNVFLEMLLLDGCFIIELFRKAAWDQPEREADPLFKADWVNAKMHWKASPIFSGLNVHFKVDD
ncbi:uncharacterized protein LOC116215432 isoform X2 [Punica granatum]|uniref:Uncharacterized protein LOC116215432 isoform X2 n=1 Tax=Punica granatum TaxID=22663 RepID=A0A6P8EJX7_PUNGR|nr:uncharacterized protein LOC116215432 isoform X2 [Punica granatum]